MQGVDKRKKELDEEIDELELEEIEEVEKDGTKKQT